MNDFHEILTKFRKVAPQTKTNTNLKEKVLDNAEDLFNELYYIFKERYEEEKNGLNTKDRKKFEYKKLWLTDDYQYDSEKEKEPTNKKHKKELPKTNKNWC